MSARALAPLALAGVLALSACGGASDDAVPAAPAPSPSVEVSESTAPNSDEPSPAASPEASDAATTAGEPPVEPTGAVPEGWTVVEPGGDTTFALPGDAAEQDVPDTGVEGLDVSLYAVPDGSLLALHQSFPAEIAGAVAPEELLAQAAAGALGAATFAEGTQTEEPFELGEYAGTEFGGLDEASQTWLAGRLLVVGDVLLGFVATDADEAAAEASLDEAWSTLTLP